MDRRGHLKEIMEFFDVKWIRFCIKAGRDSGYSRCCVTWFFIRILLMHAYGAVIGNINPFMGERRSFDSEAEYQAWKKSSEYKRMTQHVVCPWHRLIYFLTKKEHQYHTCGDCGWIQYEVHDCNNCAQDDFYETKARRKKGKL